MGVLKDGVFRFQALLRYLYTDEIEFAPWGSAKGRKVRALDPVSESYGIPKPSPKSIYRLAAKVIVCLWFANPKTNLVHSTTFQN